MATIQDTDGIVIEMTERNRSKPTWHMLLSDFANMLKAFMGANYLTIAYAFTQSGLVPGIVCLILIATVTDHCCHLIVKCKYHAIDTFIEREKGKYGVHEDGENKDNEANDEIREMRKQMVRNMTYGDVGNVAFGAKGLFIVNASLLLTQFTFCVNYFIFVGNTIHSLFPFSNTTVMEPHDNENFSDSSSASSVYSAASTAVPELSRDLSGMIMNDVGNMSNIMNYSQEVMAETLTTALYLFENVSTLAPTAMVPETNFSSYIEVTSAPDLRLLVLSPFPIFVVFAFMRNVRHLGFVSVAADAAIFVGCVVAMLLLIIGFETSSTWELYKWSTLPVFFGMATSAYEGIGTIIPIETSMEGNRHNFSKFLHGAVSILGVVLLLFGIMGYLRYGHETEQMLNKNMPNGTVVGILINVCLCIGVILTFPLQMYPVIELIEIYLFGNGRICGPKQGRTSDSDDDDDDEDVNYSNGTNSSYSDKSLLIPKEDTTKTATVAASISDQVPTWQRNVLRVLLVIAAGGLAIVLRNLYAYVGAFIGAIGSSLLAYILPCAFHLKLTWHKSVKGIQAKDIIIITFSSIASIASLYQTISEVVKDF